MQSHVYARRRTIPLSSPHPYPVQEATIKVRFPQLLKPSTLAWLREARQVKNYTLFDLLHGLFYSAFTYFYIRAGTGRDRYARRLAPAAIWVINLFTSRRGKSEGEIPPEALPPGALPGVTPGGLKFAQTYHGKVVPLETARQLVSIQQEIRIGDLEKVIPYSRARDIILQNPDHIVVIDCPCRAASDHPCLPMDVCLVIGEPFASYIVEHQPKRSRWISSQEAVEILKAEDQRGHVHHAFFKDAMFGRFYAICNCCACCCGAMNAHRNGTPMLAASGYRAVVDPDRCSGCGRCVKQCQFQAIEITQAGTRQARIDPLKCMGCGVCIDHCNRGALSLVRDASRGEPLDILRLMELAD